MLQMKTKDKKKAYFKFCARVSYVSNTKHDEISGNLYKLIFIVCMQNVSGKFFKRTLDQVGDYSKKAISYYSRFNATKTPFLPKQPFEKFT